ncbi:Transmembrane protein 97 [Podochytrium sp. JEL0797]|nr:Transmembrane protein 97 [Podochytrium sp. JEL0797]
MTSAPSRPLTSRPGDILMLIFFVLHIPITLLMDSQLLFPQLRSVLPLSVVQAADDYVSDSNDYLVMQREPWFVATLWCEMVIQLPFYLFLIYALAVDSKHVRTAGIIYGTHTCTILVPILYDMITTTNGIQTPAQKMYTTCIYSVWFFMPLCILYSMIWRNTSGGEGVKKVKKA